MSNAEFVPVLESDVHTLGMLRQQAWAAAYRGIYPDDMIDRFDFKWHEERDLSRLRDPEFFHWFICENGEKIGYLTLKNADFFYLYSLYLLPVAQKKGYGRQAMHFASCFCRECGKSVFRCHCQPDNANAMAFYRKMGGVIIAEDKDNEEKWQNTAMFEFAANDFI